MRIRQLPSRQCPGNARQCVDERRTASDEGFAEVVLLAADRGARNHGSVASAGRVLPLGGRNAGVQSIATRSNAIGPFFTVAPRSRNISERLR
jgi:hypothetical protein